MKTIKKSLRYSLYLVLVKCVFCVGLQAQDTVKFHMSAMDSIIIPFDPMAEDYITFEDIIKEYEGGLGFEKRDIPCDCFPCAAYCFEYIPKQPSYEDFKKWLLNY